MLEASRLEVVVCWRFGSSQKNADAQAVVADAFFVACAGFVSILVMVESRRRQRR